MYLLWSVVLVALSQLTHGQRFNGHCTQCKLDICFVVDASSSNNDDWNNMRTLMSDIVKGLEIGSALTRIGVVKFSTSGVVAFHLNDYSSKSDVLTQIAALTTLGTGTTIASGINKARTDCFGSANGDRSDVQNVMVILTDGKTSVGPDDYTGAADGARADGIAVIVIGLGDDPNETAVKAIAGNNDDYTLFVDEASTAQYDFINAVPAVDNLLIQLCKACPLDICFVVDSSSSNTENWSNIKGLMNDIVTDLTIGASSTRIGVIQFTASGVVVFDLDDYLTKSDVLTQIAALTTISTGTTISSGINKARDDCFGSANGDREGIQNIMIVITDGRTSVGPDDFTGAADGARAEGIDVIAIGVDARVSALEAIGGHRDDHIFFIDGDGSADYDYTTGPPAVNNLLRTSCNHDCRLDICFIVDASGSNTVYWNDAIKMMKGIVSRFRIGPTATRVGAVKFSGTGVLEFDLNKYFAESDILDHMDTMTLMDTGSNVLPGISTARKDCFGSTNGDREDAQNVMIIITDGWVNPIGAGVDESDAARGDGTAIISIGVGDNPSPEIIKALGGRVDDYIFFADDGGTADYTYITAVPAVTNQLLTICNSAQVADVCFVVDESSSISEWSDMKDLIKDFINSQRIGLAGTLVSVVEFVSNGVLTFDLVDNLSPAKLIRDINRMTQSSATGTNIAAGINFAKTACFGSGTGDRSNARNVMIVITDGHSAAGDPKAEADSARADGITVIAIGVDSPDTTTIENIAGDPQYSFFAGDYSNVGDEVAAKYQELSRTSCRLDISFMVDESRSVSLEDFNNVKTTMKDLVGAIAIGNNDNLAAVVEFHYYASTTFHLDDYTRQADVISHIDSDVVRRSGWTRVGVGIEKVRNDIFVSSNGDRSFAPNVLFVFTDARTRRRRYANTQINAARDDGIVIVSIGGDRSLSNWKIVDALAGDDPANQFAANSPATWTALRNDLQDWYTM